jgi:hypothetical protein
MTTRRKERGSRLNFHDVKAVNENTKAIFDIDLLAGFKGDGAEFLHRMLCRRHVHEHNGGEVDEKYLRDSGDTTVRIKQALRETPPEIMRTMALLVDVAKNLHNGFHDIFEPQEMPIRIRNSYLEKAKQRFSSS